MYVLLCSLHSIGRFLFNYSIKVIVVLTTFSIISILYLLNSVLQPYFMPIYSIILLYLFICNMSHVLEINYLILSYLILYDRQFGFRNNHSTTHAIITLVNKITESVDSGDIAINLFIDLRKALDTVSHPILIKKLYAYGIRGNVLELYTSYLENRIQFVVYDGVKSYMYMYTKSIDCGVPQGSILGLLFFYCIYERHLSCFAVFIQYPICRRHKYFLSGLNKLIQELNTELVFVTEWLKANKLTLNTEKTYYMVFHHGRRKTLINSKLQMDDKIIKESPHIKYLGVILDNKLNCIAHIGYVKNKVAKGIGIICKARKLITKKALLTLYNTFIFPYLIYCVEIWGCAIKRT